MSYCMHGYCVLIYKYAAIVFILTERHFMNNMNYCFLFSDKRFETSRRLTIKTPIERKQGLRSFKNPHIESFGQE